MYNFIARFVCICILHALGGTGYLISHSVVPVFCHREEYSIAYTSCLGFSYIYINFSML